MAAVCLGNWQCGEHLGTNGLCADWRKNGTCLANSKTTKLSLPRKDWNFAASQMKKKQKMWMGERADEAAQGLKVLWHHRDGIRIQVRHSDAQPVMISLRFEINNSSENPQARRAGATELIQRGLIPGGLGRHSAAEVQKLFADSSVNFQGVRITDDAIIYSATCDGKDLTRALQLLRAYMGDPGWRSEAEPQVKQAWLDSLATQEHDMAAQVQRRVATKLAGPYAWQCPARADEIKALTFADAAAWLGKNLDQSRLTLTVTGDAPEDALEIVALWFGQYRVNSPFVMVDSEGFRNMALPPVLLKPGVERVAVDSPKAEAVIHVLWPTDDMFNIVRTRRLEVVAACLNERLQKMFPERFGTNCTVTAWSSASDTVRGAGHIHVTASVAPKQADQALALIRSEAAALGENGIADELFNRVKTPLLKSLREKKRSNDWWQTMLPYASWQPFRIFWIQAFEKDYESTTAVEAGALAKQFLVDANVCAVVGSSSGKDIFTHRPGSALQCRQACAGQKNRTQP